MDLIDTINSHRSIRRYQSGAIPDETLERILNAATRASTSGNMQTYSIIITKDAERRERLWELHFEQEMIRQAPVLLTFCADWNRMNHWCRISDAEPGFDNLLCFLVGFRRFDDERIGRTYRERETEGWKRYLEFPDLARRMRESGVKNLAQVYTELKYTREWNLRFSQDLLRSLEDQGFSFGTKDRGGLST
jgi:nitroreductase